MSRYYDLVIVVSGVHPEYAREIVSDEYKKFEESRFHDKTIFRGECWLCGGESEQDAHDAISARIKAEYPSALVFTRWTYLENLPHTDYGDAELDGIA